MFMQLEMQVLKHCPDNLTEEIVKKEINIDGCLGCLLLSLLPFFSYIFFFNRVTQFMDILNWFCDI